MQGTLIHFPKQTTPAVKLAASQTATIVQFPRARKRGNRTISEMKAFIVSNAPSLTEDQRLDVIAMWNRGVRTAWIAKAKALTVWQVEAILWIHFNGDRRAA
jgi:hypothetical protein